MQEIDRRIVIVKDLFPPVHQALSIIAILAFAARTFWRPPLMLGYRTYDSARPVRVASPTNIFCHTSELMLPIRSCTSRRSQV